MVEMSGQSFSYREFTQRNLGFVSEAEQSRLATARIFVCGVGGMGGACVNALVRAGIGHISMADIDTFDVSNLNRQVFAFTDTLGQPKANVTAELCRKINPTAVVEVLDGRWAKDFPEIARRHDIIVNGMDHIASGIHLYRTARQARVPVIDAYMSPLPSVTVVRPGDPLPEERLDYPTIGVPWTSIDAAAEADCMRREIEYVLIHSSSVRHIDPAIAADVATGKRRRMSFAPMVITTGNLMAYEAIQLALGRPTGADCRGYFFNPYKPAVERPRPAPLAWIFGLVVRRYLNRLLDVA